MQIEDDRNLAARRYYDRSNHRLVYLGKPATAQMWDELWTSSEGAIRAALSPGRGTKWLLKLTERYLTPADGRILEGGCGMGHNVAALRRAGYDTIGIDFAPETVSTIRRVAPHLDVLIGDLRCLPFADDSFAGYWSLGVIEHFFSGYGQIATEMARVIRPDGYLFLTFPYMSPLRSLRARFRGYPALASTSEPEGFYQFALDADRVVREFARLGFQKCHETSMSGLQGFKDEIGRFRAPLQALYDYSGNSIVLRGVRFMTEGLSWLGSGHTCVLVLRKTGL